SSCSGRNWRRALPIFGRPCSAPTRPWRPRPRRCRMRRAGRTASWARGNTRLPAARARSSATSSASASSASRRAEPVNPSSVVPARAGTHPSASPNETIGIGVGEPTHTCGPTEPWVPALAGTTELRAEKLAAAGGVRIADVELLEPLSPELKDAIWRAFLAHHIVVFPGQFLTRGQQFAFAGNFGEVEVHGAHRGEAKRYDVAHRSEEHTSELQSPCNLVCRLLLEKKKMFNSTISSSAYSKYAPEVIKSWLLLSSRL